MAHIHNRPWTKSLNGMPAMFPSRKDLHKPNQGQALGDLTTAASGGADKGVRVKGSRCPKH